MGMWRATALCLLLGLPRAGDSSGPASPQITVRPHNEGYCQCDPARPQTLEARQCSLCREAEKQPAGELFFFLKDSNPRKPNRWLILPRAHSPGMHRLSDLSPKQRARLWKAACLLYTSDAADE